MSGPSASKGKRVPMTVRLLERVASKLKMAETDRRRLRCVCCPSMSVRLELEHTQQERQFERTQATKETKRGGRARQEQVEERTTMTRVLTSSKRVNPCTICGHFLQPSQRVRRFHASPPTDPEPARSSHQLAEPTAPPLPSTSRLDTIDELRRRTATAREQLAKGLAVSRKDLESRMVELSGQFSKLTGYEQIEELKESVTATGASHSIFAQ